MLHWNGVAQLTNQIDVNVDALNTGGCTTYFGRFKSQYQSGFNSIVDIQGGLEAYIDDLRITQFARYDADFTLPTQAYPIAPDAPPTVDPNWSNVKMKFHLTPVSAMWLRILIVVLDTMELVLVATAVVV